MGILKSLGKGVGKGLLITGRWALNQTKLTEAGRKKIAQRERDELRRLRLQEARRRSSRMDDYDV